VDNSLVTGATLISFETGGTGALFDLVMLSPVRLANLVVDTPAGVTDVTIHAPGITIDDGITFGSDDNLTLRAEDTDPLIGNSNEIITSEGGTIQGSQITLYADGAAATGFAIGSPTAPIVILITAPSSPDDSGQFDGQVNLTLPTAFGFVRADGFNTAAFTDVFLRSSQRVFIIGRFDEIVSGVQGSFITAPSFSVDSSQFRTDLNIFGVDGAGVLLPADQCEDEESLDCEKAS